MNNDEYFEYLNDVKNNLTKENREKLIEELKDLNKQSLYWLKKYTDIKSVTEDEDIAKEYAKITYKGIMSKIEDLNYILDKI